MELLSKRGEAVLVPASVKLTGTDGDFVSLDWILKTADEARGISGSIPRASSCRQTMKKACPLVFLDPDTVRYAAGPVEIRLANSPYQLLKMVCRAYRRERELPKDEVFQKFWDGLGTKAAGERLNKIIDEEITPAMSRGGIPFTVGRHKTTLYLKNLLRS